MTPLPIIDHTVSCDGCGVCCTGIGTPPGYASVIGDRNRGWYVYKPWEADAPLDWKLWAKMPDVLRQSLVDYYAAVDAGTQIDRSGEDMPCLWYDAENKRCGQYEWRPEVCREFEVGGKDCVDVRTRVLNG